jgi:hypothetical protein
MKGMLGNDLIATKEYQAKVAPLKTAMTIALQPEPEQLIQSQLATGLYINTIDAIDEINSWRRIF